MIDTASPPEPGSIGLVKTQFFTFADPPNQLELESGKRLGPITLAYETYGELNQDKSNVILVQHALSGDAHVAGRHHPDDRKPGWWDMMVGPGKALDTNKYFILCSNCIGGCSGSTGPGSINPETGRAYGLEFPIITIRDMVEAEKRLLEHLGIEQVYCVIGGSMGGMRVLQWAVSYPEMIRLAIPIATTSRLSPQAIAFDEVGRQAIMADPDWNNGDYYGRGVPARGLSIARMIGHITYLSDDSMHSKFGRDLVEKKQYGYEFGTDFQVESYLQYQGGSFVKRFDANSYLYITKAMDYFDLSQPSGNLARELAVARAKFLVISFTSDWLFPTYQSKEIVAALRQNAAHVTFAEIETPHGHDAFLLESSQLSSLISNFLEYAGNGRHAEAPHVPSSSERGEIDYIVDLVEPGSKVLDLGCGTGDLLAALQQRKKALAQGIEISEEMIQECVSKGLPVYHGNIDEGLADYADKAMDYVIVTNVIQVLQRPDYLLREAARVGRKVIVSFPNFAHWASRAQLGILGRMPVTKRLPYSWYDSPNIHLTTLPDFTRLCEKENLRILRKTFLVNREAGKAKQVKLLPNLTAEQAIFVLEGK